MLSYHRREERLDIVSAEKRSQIMGAIHSKDTKPELTLRRALWAKGLRFRVTYGKEKIDIAVPSKKLAIFVDGCFWHSCPLHSHVPKRNKDYWLSKLRRNIERDKAKNKRLLAAGWSVLRIWEHELRNINEVASEIEHLIKQKHVRKSSAFRSADRATTRY